jgi:hypothetical protein
MGMKNGTACGYAGLCENRGNPFRGTAPQSLQAKRGNPFRGTVHQSLRAKRGNPFGKDRAELLRLALQVLQ